MKITRKSWANIGIGPIAVGAFMMLVTNPHPGMELAMPLVITFGVIMNIAGTRISRR